MSGTVEPIARMAAQLARLPGIGQKSAQRLAYHIAGMPEQDVHDLAAAIWQGRKAVRFCAVWRQLHAKRNLRYLRGRGPAKRADLAWCAIRVT